MKKSANSNMYTVGLDTAWELAGARLDGAREALVCAVSSQALSEQARRALSNSAKALGYGDAACAFLALETPGEQPLSGRMLLAALEGLDPLALVVADRAAGDALAQAYHVAAPAPDAPFRLLGRSGVAFASLEGMLGAETDKQRAWALLKRLPRIE